MEQEIQPFSSSIHEIQEIMEEQDKGNNNGKDTLGSSPSPLNILSSVEDKGNNNDNDSLSSDPSPVNVLSSVDTVSTVGTGFNNIYPVVTFIVCVLFVLVLFLLVVLLVYYKPIPPRLNLNIPQVHTHKLTVKQLNATLFFELHNPNQRTDLSLYSSVTYLRIGYSPPTYKQLPPMYLKVHEYKYFQINFFEKDLKLEPEIDRQVISYIKLKKYSFSVTIKMKLKVHLNQFPLAFPYTVILKCSDIADGSTGPLLLSSCHKK